MRATPFVFLVLAIFLFVVSSTHAAPSVSSFSIAPTIGPSGFPFSLTWSLNDAGGSSLFFACIPGINAKDASTGAAVSCGTRIASTLAVTEGKIFKITNVSGVGKNITFEIIPKDTSGADYDAGKLISSISINPDPSPIKSFMSSATTTKPGEPVSISWDAPDAAGVNLKIECLSTIKATSPNYTGILPCEKLIFASPLAKSGSLSLNFTNSSPSAIPLSLALFPALDQTTFNGINTASLALNIASDLTPDPVVNSFSGPEGAIIKSGSEALFAWSTSYTKGVTMRISCADMTTATSSKNMELVLPCDKFAFSELLPSSGEIMLTFQNKSETNKALSVNLIPAFKAQEGFYATRSKTVSFSVKSASQNQTAVPPAAPTPPKASQDTTSTPPPLAPPPSLNPSLTAPVPKPTRATNSTSAPKPASPGATPLDKALQKLFEPKQEPISIRKKEAGGIKSNLEILNLLKDGGHIDLAESLELEPEKAIYSATGFKKVRLFWIIPVNIRVSIQVGAVDGSIKNIKLPWWSFLTK